MARKCNCHDPGQTRKPGYHEHRCECPCGCKSDTLGYKYCVSCHWDLINARSKHECLRNASGAKKHAEYVQDVGQIGPLLFPIAKIE